MDFNKRIADLLAGRKPLGYQQLTFDGQAAVGLTIPPQTKPEDRIYGALIYVEGNTSVAGLQRICRFREDGQDPTASVGMPLGDDWVYELQGYDQLSQFKIISANSDNLVQHKLNITYYKLGNQ